MPAAHRRPHASHTPPGFSGRISVGHLLEVDRVPQLAPTVRRLIPAPLLAGPHFSPHLGTPISVDCPVHTMTVAPRNLSDEVSYRPKAADDVDWMTSFLADQPTGVLGLSDDGAPYVVTQLFVYDDTEHAISLHGASAGRTRDVIERDGTTEAAFTVSEMGRFIPHEVPMEFTVEYASVDVFGPHHLLAEDTEKRHALERFLADFAPHLDEGEDYERISQQTMDITSVYRLDVEEWSGKRGEKAPDHPGAYELDEVRGDREPIPEADDTH